MSEHTVKTVLAGKAGRMVLLMLLAGLAAAEAAEFIPNRSGGTDDAMTNGAVSQRDPFWPVGYESKSAGVNQVNVRSAAVREERTDWNQAMEQIAIQGVSSRAGNEFYAVINGEVKSTDETVSVQIGNISYTWIIENISPPSSVKLRRVSAGPKTDLPINTQGR